MNELAKQIGDRLKDRRAFLGMTQAELAGEFITRNMLSQIENGTALPSLTTIMYLSERLSVSPDYFLFRYGNNFSSIKAEMLPHLRELFAKGDYEECYAYFKKHAVETDDEVAFILTYCALHAARRYVRSGNLDSALREIEAARRFADATVYPTDAPRAELCLLYAVASNVHGPLFSLDEASYNALKENAVAYEFYQYLKENLDFSYQNQLYSMHLRARQHMKNGDFRKALSVLAELEERKSAPEMTAFILYRINSDAEICHKELRDFESAYRYSTRRMALVSSFRS